MSCALFVHWSVKQTGDNDHVIFDWRAGKGIETVICLRHTIQLLAPIVQTLEEGLEELKRSECSKPDQYAIDANTHVVS
jgi:hypothetical protein